MPEPVRSTRVAPWLFAAFTLVYLSTANGVLQYGDDWSMLQVTNSIVERGALDVPKETPGAAPGRQGRYYSKYGVGQSLLGVPFYLAGEALSALTDRPIRGEAGLLQASPLTYAMTTLGVLASAAAVALMFLTCRALDFTPRSSMLTAIALGLETFVWHYSRSFMTEPPCMLAMLLAFFAELRGLRQRSVPWLVCSGAAAGVTVLLRVGMLVVIPPLGLWLVWALWSTRPSIGRRFMLCAAWVLPLAVALTLVMTYNFERFGAVGETGYGSPAENLGNPVWVGLYGFILSSGKSVFVYAPILLASAVGWVTLWRARQTVAIVAAATITSYLVFHAGLPYWWGGGVWGPRYAVVILPLLLLGLPALMDGHLGRVGWAATTALAAVSVFVQIESLLVSYIPFEAKMEATQASFDQLLWHPAHSPVVAHAVTLLNGDFSLDLAATYFDARQLIWLSGVEFALGFALLTVCVRRTCWPAFASSSSRPSSATLKRAAL